MLCSFAPPARGLLFSPGRRSKPGIVPDRTDRTVSGSEILDDFFGSWQGHESGYVFADAAHHINVTSAPDKLFHQSLIGLHH